MNESDRERLIDFYGESFAKYGNDARSVHWSDEETQLMRFEVLSRILEGRGESVLDAGCGLGDLHRYLLRNRIDVDYTGLDIMPEFVESARTRFPDARFVLGDVDSIDDEHDYILASGVFSFAVENSKEHYFAKIKKLFESARKGMAFNLLDAMYHKSDETYFAYDKEDVLAFCATLTPHVTLADDYLPWDFTVYLRK